MYHNVHDKYPHPQAYSSFASVCAWGKAVQETICLFPPYRHPTYLNVQVI